MADAGFNGTIVSLGALTSITNLVGVSYSSRAAAVDVSHISSTNKIYVNGFKDRECTLRTKGAPDSSVVPGLTGLLTVKFNDNTSYIATHNVIVNSVEASGDLDGDITYSIVLKPQ